MSGQENGGQGYGGGPKTERIEGSLTDGGSLPGKTPEDRSFGAGQKAEPGQAGEEASVAGASTGAIFEGQGEDPGATDEGAAGPGTEHSGYGNTPPR